MKILYKPSFVKDYNNLPGDLQIEVKEKIQLFLIKDNHLRLRVHKLSGKLKGSYSFSVNYSHRIVFEYESSNSVVFLGVGTHDIYK
jgi:mRNA-degrading endonuclease YafQ of YafQ-DinJ toxin-antitoxin module